MLNAMPKCAHGYYFWHKVRLRKLYLCTMSKMYFGKSIQWSKRQELLFNVKGPIILVRVRFPHTSSTKAFVDKQLMSWRILSYTSSQDVSIFLHVRCNMTEPDAGANLTSNRSQYYYQRTLYTSNGMKICSNHVPSMKTRTNKLF